jgi:hypothetical protein
MVDQLSVDAIDLGFVFVHLAHVSAIARVG